MKGAAPAAPDASQNICLTLGTAGHIDHGKTAIVACLTGCDCDRLPEEKARGMTIDLGFAVWKPDNQRRIGIVDVPGHERFIHNMVAGATGIDVVMLVVAADDGVMPQTHEHAQIVRMLGIRRGLIVLNKIDLADAARRDEVEAQIRALVAGSFLEQAPVVRFSARTGEGFDTFHATLLATVEGTATRDASGPFRMAVERAFVLQGIGTIVSGIPRAGAVRPGDELELLPAGTRHTVRGVQVYGRDAASGRAGECVALRLAGVTRARIGRGMTLAAPGYFRPSRFVNVRFHYLPHHDRPLEPRTAVRLHVGTDDVPGHLVLPERARLAPGAECYAQVQLARPVLAVAGDFVVVRQLSPVRTLGGGSVIDCSDAKLRRTRGDWLEGRQRQEAASGDEAQALSLALERAEGVPLTLDAWARQAGLAVEAVRPRAAQLAAAGAVVALSGDRYAATPALAAVVAGLQARLEALHDAQPLALGFEKKDILRSLGGARLLIDRAFDDLLAAGTLQREGLRFSLAARAPRLSPPEEALAAQLTALFQRQAFAAPRADELPALLGASAERMAPMLEHLTQKGVLIALDDKVLLHAESVARSRAVLEAHLRARGRLRSGEFKELLGCSRKYAIPLLEYWDRMGLTRREGDDRVLRGGGTI